MKIKARLEPGKVAVVTGGSSGIGKAIACELSQRGMDVWLLAQREDILDTARTEVEAHRKNPSQKVYTYSVDVSQLDQVHSAITHISTISGTPDLLVNSAGVTHPGYIEKLDINIFTWMMEVNYFGTVYMVKEVLPAMIKRGYGYILNVCSLSGVVASFGYTAYAASKYAVHGFSQALRMELKPHGIGISILFPTDTDTPQLAYENQFKPPETRALNSFGGAHSAEEVAKSAVAAIERGQYFILPNFDAKLINTVNRLFPGIIDYVADRTIVNVGKKKNTMDSHKV